MQTKTESPMLSDLLCPMNANVIEAMSRIDRNAKGVVFVVDENDLFLGTVTDGDIRRGLLSKKSFDFSVKELVNQKALIAHYGESDEIIEQKIKAMKPFRNIKIVPILKEGKCVSFYESTPHFFVPISSPSLLGNEMSYVHDCVSSGWISSQGSYVNRFEKMFSDHHGSSFSVSVMNATCGLQLALEALEIGEGDEVIVPSLTFAATINAVLHAGATPVMVDSKLDWCIDPTEIEKAITPKTKAIIPVHLYGQVCDMDAILSISKKYKLKVVEDCAEAQGATYRGKPVGVLGDVGCFSFFANKIMTTGEGGMNITQDAEVFERMKKLRDHGKNANFIGYYHDAVGFNFRMTNIQAAIGVAQMEKIDHLISDRARIQKHYERNLVEVEELVPQSTAVQAQVQPVCWLVSYLVKEKINRDVLMQKLKLRGVDVRPFFLPMHQMEIYKKYLRQPCPNAEFLGSVGVNFPTGAHMESSLIDKVTENIKEVIMEIKNA